MNKEAQRIAIAEACGWTHSTTSKRACFDPTGFSTYWSEIPDYLNDPNAMREALLALQGLEVNAFIINLFAVLGLEYELRHLTNMYFNVLIAAPQELAEAFLKTKRLWSNS